VSIMQKKLYLANVSVFRGGQVLDVSSGGANATLSV